MSDENNKPLTFEDLQRYINRLFNSISECYFYKSWSQEYIKERINEIYDKFNKNLEKEKENISWESFTIDQYQQLGFSFWDESKSLLLIPLYLKNQFYTKDDKYDDDVRFGCLAYGLPVVNGKIIINPDADNQGNLNTTIG